MSEPERLWGIIAKLEQEIDRRGKVVAAAQMWVQSRESSEGDRREHEGKLVSIVSQYTSRTLQMQQHPDEHPGYRWTPSDPVWPEEGEHEHRSEPDHA